MFLTFRLYRITTNKDKKMTTQEIKDLIADGEKSMTAWAFSNHPEKDSKCEEIYNTLKALKARLKEREAANDELTIEEVKERFEEYTNGLQLKQTRSNLPNRLECTEGSYDVVIVINNGKANIKLLQRWAVIIAQWRDLNSAQFDFVLLALHL